MDKIDMFKEFKAEYKAGKKPEIVETSDSQYLAIDGIGRPGSESFTEAIGALYAMAFTIKMTRKADGLGDYVICKLECQWWSDTGCLDANKMDLWQWRMMIRTPDCVTKADLVKAVEAITTRNKATGVEKVYLTRVNEGKCVQMMHTGPYDQIGYSIEIMHKFIAENSLKQNGRDHEIYISDPRRVAPENLKTILRLPVK